MAALTTGGTMVEAAEQCLYPRESETREVKSLDGVWNFVKSNELNPLQGINEKWFDRDLSAIHETIPMPVPASFNDVTVDRELQYHVGTVWYDRRFFVPTSWSKDQRVWIRFGSVHYAAQVWINGVLVVKHEIGHLPFQQDISEQLKFGQENRVTVLCDNTLIQTSIPQGQVVKVLTDNGTTLQQTYTFDFFNYAGIHRSVQLFTTPVVHIKGIHVTTDVFPQETSVTGRVNFFVTASSAINDESNKLLVHIKDKSDNLVASTTSPTLTGSVDVVDARLWWPFLMDSEPGYLYTIEVFLQTAEGVTIDVYRLKFGIRSLSWNNKQFLINGRPVYFRGFGRHEDSDIRGKGLDLALLTRDFNLLKWVGANAYRTSHYPYSEESMQFADEHGIMVIDECPSVDTDNYTPALLSKHKSSLEQLILRDRNHPSVVMWSIANEPRVGQATAQPYFGEVANFTRSMDPLRPVTAAIATPIGSEQAGMHMDIISFNRYNGWYSNPGQTKMISQRIISEARAWHAKYNKPVIMMEFGADTISGYHSLPSFVWSEEYQVQLLARHFRAFDELRELGFFIGEFIWNFADFMTNQGVNRAGGNKKGIFTRQRQPKEAAHFVRRRYYALAHHLDDGALPDDLSQYVFGQNFLKISAKQLQTFDEVETEDWEEYRPLNEVSCSYCVNNEDGNTA